MARRRRRTAGFCSRGTRSTLRISLAVAGCPILVRSAFSSSSGVHIVWPVYRAAFRRCLQLFPTRRPSHQRLYPRVTDDSLVERARAGDREAFAALIECHRAAALRAAMAVLGDRASAEDATQDACLAAWRGLDEFRGEASFKTWLLTITWRTALSQRRRWSPWWHSLTTFSDYPEASSSTALRSPVDAAPLAEDVAVDRSELALVRQTIRALPARLRHPLLLAGSGLGMQEIAGILGLPVGTVKWRISEARRVTREKVARRTAMGATR